MEDKGLDQHNVDKHNLIAALRVWRNRDQEDFLVMSRHEVISLIEEIDHR